MSILDDERAGMIHTPPDNRKPGTGLPRHSKARAGGWEPKQGTLWSHHDVVDPGGQWGTFPRGFFDFALGMLGNPSHGRTLHVCSGSLPRDVIGYRLDIRESMVPDVRADGRALPFKDGVFDAILIDPPWSVEYARDLYQTEYPRPAHLMREAARVASETGRIGMVHFFVPQPPPGWKLDEVRGITQGCGYRIRALAIYSRRKLEPELFGGTP